MELEEQTQLARLEAHLTKERVRKQVFLSVRKNLARYC